MSDYSISSTITADSSGFMKAINETIAGLEDFGDAFSTMTNETKQSFANLANQFTAIDAKAKVWGNSTEVVADKQKALRAEINRLIDSGIKPESQQIQDLKKSYDALGTSGVKSGSSIASSFASLRDIMQGPIAALQLAKQALDGIWSATIGQASKIEDMEAAFTPLVDGAENAKIMIAALNAEAATTPFELTDIGNVAKQLLPVLGNNVEAVTETFRMLGDTAGGNVQKLDSITRGYVKVLNSGKVTLEALNMITDAGVPIIKQLGNSMGVSTAEIYKMVSAGDVAASDLTTAFQKMTSEGGIFFNGMDIASQTLSGKLSTMADSFKMAGAAIGDIFLPFVKSIVTIISDVVGGFAKWATENDNLANTLKYLAIGLASGAVAFGVFSAAMNMTAIITTLTSALKAVPVVIKAITAALAANPFVAIATVLTAILIPAIIALADKLGGWKVLFLEIQKIALKVLESILDYFSFVANNFIKVINTLLKAYNKIISVVGGKPIKLFDEIDIATSAGITKKIVEINNQIVKEKKAKADLAIQDDKTHKTIVTNKYNESSVNEEAAKLAISWSDKLEDAVNGNIESQKAKYLQLAKDRNAGAWEIYSIAKEFDDKILANYVADINEQRTASIKEAKEKGADAKTVKDINAYYDLEITNYKQTQIDARDKLEKSYTDEVQKEEKKRTAYVKQELNTQDGVFANIVGSWKNYWADVTKELETNAADWTDVFKSIEEGLTSVAKSGLQELGEALVDGSFDWADFGAAAMSAMSNILAALGQQLAGMALLSAGYGNWGLAAAQAAGSAAAFVASGVVGALANTSDNAADAATNVSALAKALDATVESAEDFVNQFATKISSGSNKKLITTLESQTSSLRESVESYQAQYDVLLADLRKGGSVAGAFYSVQYALKAAKEALNTNLDTIAAAYKLRADLIANATETVTDSIEDTNNTVSAYIDLFTQADEANLSYLTSLEKVRGAAEDFYSSLSDIGTDIASNLVDNLVDGLTESDFLTTMKEYITKVVIQAAVYTEALSSKLASIGAKIANAVAGGVENYDMSSIVSELKSVYETASKTASAATAIVSKAFSGYASGTSSAVAGYHMVGEQGPELMYTPGGSTIYNNNETNNIIGELAGGGSRGTNVTLAPVFNSPKAMNQAEQMRAMKQYQKQLAFKGVI